MIDTSFIQQFIEVVKGLDKNGSHRLKCFCNFNGQTFEHNWTNPNAKYKQSTDEFVIFVEALSDNEWFPIMFERVPITEKATWSNIQYLISGLIMTYAITFCLHRNLKMQDMLKKAPPPGEAVEFQKKKITMGDLINDAGFQEYVALFKGDRADAVLNYITNSYQITEK